MFRSLVQKHVFRGAVLSFAVLLPPSASIANVGNLTLDCEIAVARSALPKRLRDGASIYALTEGEYKLVTEAQGPFTCIVERNHQQTIAPQCMDRAGVDSLLPAIISRSMMALAGATVSDIASHDQHSAEDGTHRPPARAGISYMMSDYNYIFVESANRVLKIAPHVMYYAPGISNEDVGGSLKTATENVGTPFVLGKGPHALMIVYTEHKADPDEVAEKCRGQLGEPPPAFNPFPQG